MASTRNQVTSKMASVSLSLILWLSFWAALIDAAAIRSDLHTLLTDPARRWSPTTTVSFPNSTEFTESTERWTVFRPPTYRGAIRPGTEADVAKIIKLATSHNIPFLVTGGRHGYTTTLGDLQDGLAIDLSQLDSIEIDQPSETLTVGPGVRVGEILDPLYEAGFELPTGSASCPSLIGITIGGGVGRSSGVHGLVIDSLQSVRIVTADGEVRVASQTSNSDLFWGIRGAGANFGVITSATYKIYSLVNEGEIFASEFIFPTEKSAAFFDICESFKDNLPAELAAIVSVNFNSSTGKPQITSSWVYLGPEDEGREVLKPLFDLEPDLSVASVVPWNKLISSTGDDIDKHMCETNEIRDLYDVNLKTYSASTYNTSVSRMIDYFENYPGGRNSFLQFEFFPNQAMVAVPSNDTAFPWRDTTGYINTVMSWSEGDTDTEAASNAVGEAIRREMAETSGFDGLRVFVSYARGDEELEQIYGEDKLPRLAQLKEKWDPEEAFSFNNGLPLRYG